jgi:hypothetical protein
MAYGKTEVSYVDINANGKAIPLDVLTLCSKTKVNVKAMEAKLANLKALRQQANDVQTEILATLEDGMHAHGMLETGMALNAWFKFGNYNVVRVYADRAGKASKASNNASSNVDALFASKSTLIRKR